MTQRTSPSSDFMPGRAPSEPRIVAVEDDTLFRELLVTELTLQSFSVMAFPDAESLLNDEAVAKSADAILVGWSLPGLSGLELCSELRNRGVRAPVIFLTEHPRIENEQRALRAGAVDFIDKKRGFGILVRRLNLVMKGLSGVRVQRRRLRHGRLLLNPVEGRATWDQVDLSLTLGEYRVVELLIAKSPHPATYDEIHDQVRSSGTGPPTSAEWRANIRSTMRRIRAKFRRCDAAFAHIENDATRGYFWSKNDRDQTVSEDWHS